VGPTKSDKRADNIHINQVSLSLILLTYREIPEALSGHTWVQGRTARELSSWGSSVAAAGAPTTIVRAFTPELKSLSTGLKLSQKNDMKCFLVAFTFNKKRIFVKSIQESINYFCY
jgi:hypothetical protein